MWPNIIKKIKVFYNFFDWFVFYFQKLTYGIMLGHMQKVNHFWAQIKKTQNVS